MQNEPPEMYGRVVGLTEALWEAATVGGVELDPERDIAIYAHPDALRPFALGFSTPERRKDVRFPSPYERGWKIRWRNIHVIERSDLLKDRITIHLGFAPAVHLCLNGECVLAIDPITLERTKLLRGVAERVVREKSY